MKRKRGKIKDAEYENHYVYNTHYHLIWCTKYRNPIFTNQALADEMRQLLEQIAQNNQVKIEKIEVMPDHIHLLVNFRPSKSGSSIIKALKGRSGRLFFQNHPEIKRNKTWGGHLWSPSYYFGSVSDMPKEVVEKYVNDQAYNAVKDSKFYPSQH